MEQVLELSKQNTALSRAEAEMYCDVKGRLVGNYLILDSGKRHLEKKLAYTKSVGKLGFCLKRKVRLEEIKNLVGGSYCFRFVDVQTDIKKELLTFTKHINQKVSLNKPDTTLIFIQAGNSLLCVVNPAKNIEKYESRRAHLRPSLHPSSMHPRLSRAFVNLTGIQSGVLYDPFCGSGGILIEAGLRGLTCAGSDISQIMLKRSSINCKHYGVNPILFVQDALEIKRKYKFIATDLAYGKSTIFQDDLVKKFFERLPSILGKRAVIGVTSSFNNKDIPLELKVVSQFSYYLHRTLSKKILVLEKQ